jgi:hypothetical protein
MLQLPLLQPLVFLLLLLAAALLVLVLLPLLVLVVALLLLLAVVLLQLALLLYCPSPSSASLFIIILTVRHNWVPIGLVYSIHDSTEVAIQKMIEASQRMIAVNSQVAGEAREGWGINPAVKRHLELENQDMWNNN